PLQRGLERPRRGRDHRHARPRHDVREPHSRRVAAGRVCDSPHSRAATARPAPDMAFENHAAGESAQGDDVRRHIGAIFETWPDIRFETRRLYVRDGVVAQEWTATATHPNTMGRGGLVAGTTGRTVRWRGVDVIPFENGLVKRKDVYSDSVSILRQVGLLE